MTPAAPTVADAEPSVDAELWLRLRADDAGQLRAQLIERHLPYARIVAAGYYARRMHDEIEFNEYLQMANLALVESVDRYEPDGGAQFKTFAARRMHGAILDGLEKATEKQQQIAARRRLRRERVEAAKDSAGPTGVSRAAGGEGLLSYLAEVGIGLALGILLEGTGMVDTQAAGATGDTEQPYRQVELAMLRRRVAEVLRQLPQAQRRVLELHYFQEHSLADIARHLELTKGRVSQVHRQGLDALRSALRPSQVCQVTC